MIPGMSTSCQPLDRGNRWERQAWLLVSALALFLGSSCRPASPPPERLRYRISTVLDPAAQFLRATATISLAAPSSGVTSAEFLLHRQLKIMSLGGPAVAGYQIDTSTPPSIPWIPNAARVTVSFDRPLNEDQVTEISVEYEGVLDTWPQWSANVIGGDWTELGLYLPWFPYFGEDYDPFTFEVEAEVPAGFVVQGLGEAERDDGIWKLHATEPVRDIVLVSSRDLRTTEVEANGFQVRLHCAELEEQEAQRLGGEVLGILETYAEWFGPPESQRFTLIESRREMGGGYAREGLVVLSRLNALMAPEAYPDLLRYLAHEVAHLWWHAAPSNTWEDWLDESFAEYSALLLLKTRFGEAEFRDRIAAKREAAQGVPPIWGFDRSDTSTEEKSRQVTNILYSAGPVALDELNERISHQKFLEWCRQVAALDVASTSRALELLRDLAGLETADWFEQRLHEPENS